MVGVHKIYDSKVLGTFITILKVVHIWLIYMFYCLLFTDSLPESYP